MSKSIRWRKDGAHVVVLGATGAVGREMVHCLEALHLSVRALDLLASERSAGKEVDTFAGRRVVQDASQFDFSGADIVLCSAGKSVSLALADRIVKSGAIMIDNTSAFRRDPAYPLVVPEVNGDLIHAESGIIANPNCSTIQLVLALKALEEAAGLEEVRVSTYQSCSGAGQKGIDALMSETRESLDGHRPLKSEVHARTIAFDVVPQIGPFLESGYTEEEDKMMFETRKILNHEDLRISATCVRVPVVRSHSEMASVVTKTPLTVREAQEVLNHMPGLRVTDMEDMSLYPTATQASGLFETLVGRVRRDCVSPNGLIFWIVSDNLLKGAALNAVQIACSVWDHARMASHE